MHIDETLLRLPDVIARIGFSRAWIYAAVADGRFPKPLKVGGRAVAWRASDVAAWIDALAATDASVRVGQ